MLSKSNSGVLFLCFAMMVSAAWTTLILSFVAFDPLGLVRGYPGWDRTAGHGEPTHVVTALLSARSGPASPLTGLGIEPSDSAPVLTQVHLNSRDRRAVFAGRGESDARVAMVQAERVIVYTRVRDDRRWVAAANFDETAGHLGVGPEEEARRLAEERAREAEARRQAEAERLAFIEAQQRAEEKERRHQDVGAQDALARAERERQEAERAESDRIAALEARRRRLANLRESREAARQRLAPQPD